MNTTKTTIPTRDGGEIGTARPSRGATPVLGVAKPMGPLAADLHRLAAFITTHDLPAGDIAVFSETGGTVVALTTEGAVRQWAKALNDAPVSTGPCLLNDQAAVLYEASGLTDSNAWVHVGAKVLPSASTR